MPATESILRPVSSTSALSRVSVYGERDASEPVRFAMPVTVHLSFFDVLGLLTYTPGVCITNDDLDNPEVDTEDCLRQAVEYALVDNSADAMELAAHKARHAYHGDTYDAETTQFIRRLGAAVTRLFGVAPEGGAL